MSRHPADRVGVFGRNLARERRLRAKSPRTLALLADVSVSEIDRMVAGLGLRAVHDVEAGKATAQLATWVKALDALELELVVAPLRRL